MRVIKVATDDGKAYYTILSRLKRTHLEFVGMPPSEVSSAGDELVITTLKESHNFSGVVFAIENLSADPMVMEGQILSNLLQPSKRTLLVGIDPGLRTGVVVLYGGRQLGSLTIDSVERLMELLVNIANNVPHSGLSIKIGNGQPRSAVRIAALVNDALPSASTEIVNEAGTTTDSRGGKRVTRDQKAALKIALRRGMRFMGVSRRNDG